MNVFLTGGTGFVGSHTCRALLESGHSVTLFVRNESKARAMFDHPGCTIVVGDILSEADVSAALRGCDTAIHVAAMVSTSKRDAQRVFRTNLAATKNVIGKAVAGGCKTIIHVSSVTAIYDSSASTLNHQSPLGDARNAYGRSKVECERYVRSLQAQGAPIHITYPGSVIGPDAPGITEPHEGILTTLLPIGFAMPSGNQYVDVRDVAAAHAALVNGQFAPGRFPLGGHFVSWKAFYATLSQLTGRRQLMLPAPGFIMRLVGRVIDVVKNFVEIDTPLSHEATVYATRWVKLDDTHTLETLGVAFRPFEESLIDSVAWLERENYITRHKAGKLSRHNQPAQ